MEQRPLSRRAVLRLGAAGLAGAVLGVSGWEAGRYLTKTGSPGVQAADAPEPKAPPVKAVIDAHIHVVNTKLPGVPLGHAPDGTPFGGDPERLAKAIQAEMKEGHVTHALCMPSREMNEKDALGVEETRALAKLVPGLHPVGLADPERTYYDKHLERVEDELKRGDVVAFKAYLGYLHHGPDSPGYRPYYRLAAKYRIPVIFHTGDNWSQKAKVKYAHPLPIDEVAVDFPETNFVIAHLGNPWLMDAAEVIYKNNKKKGVENVWADLSAFLVGTADEFAAYRKQGVVQAVIAEVRKAFEFAERPDRFLFGSDWPLAPLAVYRDFISELVPKEHHQAVFHDNAKALFRLEWAPQVHLIEALQRLVHLYEATGNKEKAAKSYGVRAAVVVSCGDVRFQIEREFSSYSPFAQVSCEGASHKNPSQYREQSMANLSPVTLILFAFYVGCLPISVLAKTPPSTRDKEPESAEAVRIKALRTELRDVQREQIKLLQAHLQQPGQVFDYEERGRESLMLLLKELETAESGKERVAALDRHLKLVKECEEATQKIFKAGKISNSDLLTVQILVRDAEIAIKREQLGRNPGEEEKAALKKLLFARRDSIKNKLQFLQQRIEVGVDSPVILWDCSCELLSAELELSEKPAARSELHAEHLKLASVIERIRQWQLEAGKINEFAYTSAKGNRVQAEINLLRDRGTDAPLKETDAAQLKKLLKERGDALGEQIKGLEKLKDSMPGIDVPIALLTCALLPIELDLSDADSRLGLHKMHLERLKAGEKYTKVIAEKFPAEKGSHLRMRELRLNAEIDLLHEQMKASSPSK